MLLVRLAVRTLTPPGHSPNIHVAIWSPEQTRHWGCQPTESTLVIQFCDDSPDIYQTGMWRYGDLTKVSFGFATLAPGHYP
jgi:hypothetical protein